MVYKTVGPGQQSYTHPLVGIGDAMSTQFQHLMPLLFGAVEAGGIYVISRQFNVDKKTAIKIALVAGAGTWLLSTMKGIWSK